MAAFAAIKSGVKLGKDAHSMMGDIGKMWGAIDEIKHGHTKSKKSPFSSVEEEALSTFAAKKKAEDLEEELKKYVIMTRGIFAWRELLQLRGQIRKARIVAAKKRQAEIQARIEIGACVFLFVVLCAGMVWGVWLWLG
tara:strand:- start:193 stop:606 length:414 start_codon:yes stop_codon:yes gene_type:complete